MFEHYVLVKVKVIGLVIEHKVLSLKIVFVHSSTVGTCDMSTKIYYHHHLIP